MEAHFSVVDTIAGVPTAAELAAYDTVLVYNNGGHSNPAGLGDVLADFFDANGHVVEALYGTANQGSMAGRWASGGYRLLSGPYSSSALALDAIAEPASPLMVDINTFTATRSVNGTAINGGIVVASYDNGTPIVVRGTKNGRNRVDIGMFPGGCSGPYWTGDGFELIRNALRF